MVSGFEKYFQIVRCFRDEDLRADRQPEFTQIDLEMSFPQQERIFEVIEPLVQRVCKVAGFDVPAPFPRLTYAQAMRDYGSDKPDLRIPPMYPVAGSVAGTGERRACRWWRFTFPRRGTLSRKERDEFKAFGQERGLRVFDDVKRLERDYPEQMAKVRERCGATEDDLLVLAGWAGEPKGHRPEETVLSGLRATAAACRAEVQRPAQAAGPEEFSSSCGWSISRCSNGTRKRTAGMPRIIRSLRCTTRISRS